MKKITLLLFLALTGMLNVANAQDITVFNFDGTTPTLNNEWGTDTFVSVPNPVSDEVNGSANVGMFTDNTEYANMVADVDIDPNLYRSVQFKVYSPNAGRVGITFKNALGETISSFYSSPVAVSAGWTIITKNITLSQQIKKIVFGFSDDDGNATPEGETTDVVYLDDLTFIKTASTDKEIYVENFTAKWEGGDWTGIPSTKAGQWFGGINLETTADANMTLNQHWNDYGHVVKMAPAAAAVIIPNINITGFNNLKLSFDFANAGPETAPIIEASIDGGAFSPLTTNVGGAWWGFGTQVITLPAATSTISLRINPSTGLNDVFFDNLKVTGTAVSLATESNQLSDNSIKVYPNPFTSEFKVDATNSEGPLQVSVFDVLGRKVATAKSSSNQLSMGSSLNSGVYIVKVEGTNAKDSKSFKIIKK